MLMWVGEDVPWVRHFVFAAARLFSDVNKRHFIEMVLFVCLNTEYKRAARKQRGRNAMLMKQSGVASQSRETDILPKWSPEIETGNQENTLKRPHKTLRA